VTTTFASAAELQALVGQEVAVSEWLEIAQPRVDQFAEATEDRQWIHLDAARAQRESPFGVTIAHGFLSLSLVSYLLERSVQIGGITMGLNYGLNRVRFPAPVLVGSRIRGHFVVQACEAIPNGHQITWGVTIEAENAPKPVCVAEWIVRLYA
jgi:acyl dehydratase